MSAMLFQNQCVDKPKLCVQYIMDCNPLLLTDYQYTQVHS